MTTTVKIDAHAGWPVRVTRLYPSGDQAVATVEPNTEGTFYVHSTMDLHIHEVQRPEVPTFGQKAVGASFNPSSLPKVDRLKALYAEIVDLCNAARSLPDASPEAKRLYSVAITEAQGAQMWAVKAATWKD
jgi:hypothetical protein